MNTSTLDHHGHFEIPKKAIELFIMKVMAPARLYLETNIRQLEQESSRHLNCGYAIDYAKGPINEHGRQHSSKISGSNTDMINLTIKE